MRMEEILFLIFLYIILGMRISSCSQISIANCPSGRRSVRTIGTFSVPASCMSTTSDDESVSQSLEFVLNSNYTFSCGNGFILQTVEIDESRVVFTKFGHFGRFGVINGSKVIHWLDPEKFCGSWQSTILEAEDFNVGFCQPPSHLEPTIVFKCCRPGYIMDLRTQNKLTCQPLRNRSWTPTLYDPESFKRGTCARELDGPLEFQFVNKIQDIPQSEIYLFKHPQSWPDLNISESGIWWYLLKDGRLRSRKPIVGGASGSELYDDWEDSILFGRFCVDGLVNSHHIPEFSHKISEIAIIEVKPNSPISIYPGNITLDQKKKRQKEERSEGKSESYRVKNISYVAAFYISTMFLFGVLCKSMLLVNKKNLRGITLITYAASLLLANLFSGLSSLMNFILDLRQLRGYWCTSLAMLTHFFILASACWLVLVAWELLRALRCPNPDIDQPDSLLRYVCYFCGVFGSLTIIVTYLFYRDQTYGAFAWFFSPCPVLVPGYGVDWCFLSYQSQGKLLYIPLLVLNTIGLILYLATIRRLYNVQTSHYWLGEYIVIHSRTEPSLTRILQLLLVEFISGIIGFISSYWNPNVLTPEDASFPVMLVSVTVIVSRAMVLFLVLNAGDPEVSDAESRRLHSLVSTLNAQPTGFSDYDDDSSNANEMQLQMVLPQQSSFRNLMVQTQRSWIIPHPYDPGNVHQDTGL